MGENRETNKTREYIGLTGAQAEKKLRRAGLNALPESLPPSLARIFIRQFLSPLIYILLIAAAISLTIGHNTDAVFIAIVLLINGVIGTIQEYSAEKDAASLKELEQPQAIVLRDGIKQNINAKFLVPEDVVFVETGGRVAADILLFEAHNLECDESLLTGESMPVKKAAEEMIFAGSIVLRGSGRGVVVATGKNSEIGKIAGQVAKPSLSEPPLAVRMRKFTRNIAVITVASTIILAVLGFMHEVAIEKLVGISVALAVSAIPEGLPIAVSVALAVSMRRMAKKNVIARNLTAIESLGSCTLIATDKTGTLTLNELTVTDIILPDGTSLTVETGAEISSCRIHADGKAASEQAVRLLRAAVLPNEGRVAEKDKQLHAVGDTVDVALLAAAHKGGIKREELLELFPQDLHIPYEPEIKYSASFHSHKDKIRVFVKGAPETLLHMCDSMAQGKGAAPIDKDVILAQQENLSAQGLKVLAFAEGEISDETPGGKPYGHHHLINLTFLGMAGMTDPIRPEVPAAIAACHEAGIKTIMITGDAPKTASAIAHRAGIEFAEKQVTTGVKLSHVEEKGEKELDELVAKTIIYARVSPLQKLAVILSLARVGNFVAVTGDGVNDAPCLKHAHVGVAMGKKGTEIAKESADIIITDDNFASIVEGVREGRVAYANIRKVIFMLASTGAAELTLFILAGIFAAPMPLLSAQILWLNLVTNGIQDIALACEGAEGNEMKSKPRKPDEPIFDRLMIRRIIYSTIVMGGGGFATFSFLLQNGYSEEAARNMLLILFILFENFQTLNSRSERKSVFKHSLFSNPFLIIGLIGSQLIHIAAMYLPWTESILQISPISLSEWLYLLLIASVLLLVMEIDKLFTSDSDSYSFNVN